jgi:hypothetical protein
MMHRYFLIEPLYSDPDAFCNFTIGSGRVRANIQIYADEWMLAEVAKALGDAKLAVEHPQYEEADFDSFWLRISVLPSEGGQRTVRFMVYHGMCEDDAPFTADIRFHVSPSEAEELSRDLLKWLKKKNYPLEWKP